MNEFIIPRVLPTAPVLALTLLLFACGGPSGGTGADTSGAVGSGPYLQISTPAQGAQAAWASIDAGRDAAVFGTKLSAMAGQAAAAIATLPGIGTIPVTFDCTSRNPVFLGNTSTPNSVTVTKRSTHVTAFFNTCRSGSAMTEGGMTVDLTGGTTLTFTLGSAYAPLKVTDYASAASSVVTGQFLVSATLSYSTSAGTDTMVVSGWSEHWDTVRHTHDRYDLTNVFLTATKSARVIGADAYESAGLTVQGSMTKTAFASDIDPAVLYTESIALTGFTATYATPAAGSAAAYEYLSVNGDISIVTQPPGRCIDGAFSIVTNSELQVDRATGAIVAGQVTVNSAAAATFNADGSVTVTIAGTPPAVFTRSELSVICPI